jgi:integrase
MKRSGSVERLPSGNYRARTAKGETIGTFASEHEADLALAGGNIRSFWPGYAVRRRQIGVRDWSNDESRYELYIARDPIAETPLRVLKRRDVKAWLARMHGRGLAAQTIKNALNLLRGILADALDSELCDVNPAVGVKVHRSAEARTHEGWTILDPDEQLALLRAVPDEEAHTVEAALFWGLRNSELWALRVSDIDLEAREVVVRFSKGDRPVKSGKIRRVPLFGPGFEAAARAVELAKGEYAFPSPRTGERRYDSSHPSRWARWLKAAGIQRPVRWYDLRHSCATSLLAGWWGRKWSIDEVRQVLGHSSVKMTERYAHLVDDTLKRAARATPGLSMTWREAGANSRVRTGDLRFTNASRLDGFQLLALRDHYARHCLKDDQLAGLITAGVKLLLSGGPMGDVRRACELGSVILDTGEALERPAS